MNEYYNDSGYPATGASPASSPMRSELAAVRAGFDKLPVMAGNGSKAVKINAGGTALSVSKVTITEPATSATLTIDDGFTLHATGNVTALSGSNTGDQTAATTPNTPAGNIAATTVQAALNELDTEKACLAGSASQTFSASTAAQFNNTTTVATTAFVKGVGISMSGNTAFDTSQTLTAGHCGRYIYLWGTNAITLTLPLAGDIPVGACLIISNSQQYGAGTTVVQRAGSDTIYAQGTNATSFSLGHGDSFILISTGASQWLEVIGTRLAGSASQTFSVAAGTGSQAVNKTQADATFAALAGSASQAFAASTFTGALAGNATSATNAGYATSAGTVVNHTPSFTSTNLVITASTVLNVAHGFGVKPVLVRVVLKCTTADLAYSVGDEVESNYLVWPGTSAVSVASDATVVTVILIGASPIILHKSTGIGTAITLSSWCWVVRAWI